jgi:V-type H+-transporting ATPase subunit F
MVLCLANRSAYPYVQDTVTGFVLAGVGHRNAEGSNFLVVKAGTSNAVEVGTSSFYMLFCNVDTDISVVEEFFKKLTSRDDIAIVLINQSASSYTILDLRVIDGDVNSITSADCERHTPFDP